MNATDRRVPPKILITFFSKKYIPVLGDTFGDWNFYDVNLVVPSVLLGPSHLFTLWVGTVFYLTSFGLFSISAIFQPSIIFTRNSKYSKLIINSIFQKFIFLVLKLTVILTSFLYFLLLFFLN